MILNHNKTLIKNTLGKQGSQQCGVYAVAYGYTILEGKCRVSGNPASHQSVANKYNGGTFAVCQWSTMKVSSKSGSSVKDRYAKIISELQKGKPVVVAVKGTSTNHYVLVIGVRDGKTSSNVKESDFYIIDPADCGFGYFGSTWAKGFNQSGYGLQYCTFNNGKGVSAGGDVSSASGPDKSWYIKKYGTGAEVYFELQKYGYSHKACCAVLGNMQQESGIRVYTGGSYDGNGSEGLCQWTGGRKTNMQKYAAEHSTTHSWKSVDGQVAYLVYELEHTEKASNTVLKTESLTLNKMTEDFEKKFERAGTPNMAARIRYANEWNTKMSGADSADGSGYGTITSGGYAVNMQRRSSQLYSSDNYKWIEQTEQEESEAQKAIKEKQKSIKDFLTNLKLNEPEAYSKSGAISNYTTISTSKITEKERLQNSSLSISQAMVEAPFVEVNFGGTIIGTYNNSVDKFPNHISRLEIEKVNGEINKYTFVLVHQIRPGEDPNLIDKILSKVKYSSITIKYGDFNSNVIYGDEKAIITNVAMNRDYVSNRISYTIYATSAGQLITSYKLNFPARTAKPSTIINELLYSNPETSKLLLQSFPGMKNTTLVSSNNLIPTNDAILSIDEKYNINTVEYINYLVSCMSNVSNGINDIIRNSVYYISYENDFSNTLGGAFFKISEVTKGISGNIGNNIFEVTVGFPDNNYVMGFSVDNNIAWSLLYENMSLSDEFIYSIDNRGNKIKEYSPNLMSSSSILNEIQKNWWTQMINFPINATLTLKGLMKPVMLMNYVIINVVFYGQKHITSGIYTITGQRDTLSGEGFRTTLSLTRVGDK